MRNTNGEIITVLTIVTMLIVTFGLYLGTQLVTQRKLTSTSTFAQSPSIIPHQANLDASLVTMTFGPIIDRNNNQKWTTGNLCFKPEGNNPPNSGNYYIKAYARVKGQGPFEVGSSLATNISTQRGAFRCPNQQKYDLFFYRDLTKVPGIPANSTVSDIESVGIYIQTGTGTWEPTMANPVATIGNPAAVFDKTPRPTSPPTTVTVTTTPPVQPEVCPGIASQVPPAVIAAAVANPSSVPGWGQPHVAGQPISSTNPVRNKLTLTDKTKPFAEDNPLVFKAYCTEPTTPPVQPEVCPGIASQVPPAVIAAAVANPSSVPGWGQPHVAGQPISSTNPVRNKLTLTDKTKPFAEDNPLVFKAYCTEPTGAPTLPTTTTPPTTPPPSNTSTRVTLAFVHRFSKNVTELTLEACANDVECLSSTVKKVNIAPQVRDIEYFNFAFRSPINNTVLIKKLTGKIGSGISTSQVQSDSFSKDLNARLPGGQNIILYVSAGDGEITSQAKTESQAADVSADGCVNINDAALLIAKLGTIEESLTACSATDIDCNGFNNALDLSIIIENLNQGFGCVYNQP